MLWWTSCADADKNFVLSRNSARVYETLLVVLGALWAHRYRRGVFSDVMSPAEEIYGDLHHADKLILARRQKASFNAMSNR